jgi:dihydroorotate dehydrogenase
MFYRNFIKPVLFSFDPEKAHDLAMKWAVRVNSSISLQRTARALFNVHDSKLEQKLMGLHFPNPVGIAAGFDKNGLILRSLQAIGFGFIEIGSITARPSKGNEKPRMFRLPDDRAIINRMGLNNDGADVIIDRLDKKGVTIPVGINIAKTHDPSILGDAAIDDYVYSFIKAEEKADYIMVNISCPNTAEGITFEQPGPLTDLLGGISSSRKRPAIPMLVKFSPDVSDNMLDSLVSICIDAGVTGFAISNTSTSRDGLLTATSRLDDIGRGGLSGQPLRSRAERLTKRLRALAGSDSVLVGIGGIENAVNAMDRLEAGANLLQVYTGLIYEGPSLPGQINREIKLSLEAKGMENVAEITHLR